jgi:transposase-like protein
LSKKYGKSKRWIQRKFDEIKIKSEVTLNPQPLVLVADTTFFSRTDGLCVFRFPHLKKNVWWKFTQYEKANIYEAGKQHLEKNGFVIQAIVLDGKRGIKEVFKGIPVQLCHFHQAKTIDRYLTTRPKLEAGQELRIIIKTLTRTNENIFTKQLNNWYDKWNNFLKEKTTNPETGRWCYTHKRLRSAYKSLKNNLPFLFTYQKYPKLNIPNTTNSLDGYFSVLKGRLNVHKGLNKTRRNKAVIELLKGQK